MKLLNKTILLISPEPWSHIFVSKHHYATILSAKGNKVYFLNPPTNDTSCKQTDFENVFTVNYKGFIKGLRFLPPLLQRIFIRQKLKELQKLCKVNFNIIWSFDNSVFFDFSALPKEVYCISHIVDLNQDFEFEKAGRTANLCIGLIPAIVEKFSGINKNVIQITHGVNLFDDNVEPIVLPGQNKGKAVYAGNLNMKHIDWKLLHKVTIQFSRQLDFIFVGDNHDKIDNKYKKKVSEQNNTFFIPKVNYKELYRYLSSADILFLAYLPSYDTDCALPHKLFEYLQTGRIVISNWINSYYEIIAQVDILCSSGDEEYILNFNRAIKTIDIEGKNPVKVKNIEFAISNSYDNQISKIENYINF